MEDDDELEQESEHANQPHNADNASQIRNKFLLTVLKTQANPPFPASTGSHATGCAGPERKISTFKQPGMDASQSTTSQASNLTISPSSTSTSSGTGKAKFAFLEGWYADVFRLLSVSRYGLTEKDILAILPILGYKGKGKNQSVTRFDWHLFRNVTREIIFETNIGLGTSLLRFMHDHLKETVEYVLLGIYLKIIFSYFIFLFHVPKNRGHATNFGILYFQNYPNLQLLT